MSQQLPNNNNDKSALDVHLAEYERIWQEIFARFESQRQSINYLLAALAALVSLLAAEKLPRDPELFFWVPLILAPFGFIFFDNELMIWGIVRYTRNHLHKRIAELVGDDRVMLMEVLRFEDNFKARTCHYVLSLSRWSLFVLPIGTFMVYASLKTVLWWKSLYILLFLADFIVISILIWAMYRASVEQRLWKGFVMTESGEGNEAA